jgi:hypothetical protein
MGKPTRHKASSTISGFVSNKGEWGRYYGIGDGTYTYHGEVEALLLQLGERGYCLHLVRLEALRVRARIVHFYHARANIHPNELGNIRCERTRDLAYTKIKIS